MFHFLLRPTLAVILVFTASSLAARALGSIQPLEPALTGFTVGCADQPQPCWFGIVPGVTTAADATRLLTAQGYTESSDGLGTLVYWQPGNLCSRLWVGRNEQRITRIGMPLCADVRLGSLAALFNNAFHIITQSGVTLLKGQVALGLGAGDGECMNINPFGRVAQIWLSAESEVQNFKRDLPVWRGYLSFARYQQLYGLGCVPLRLRGVK
jgi:hypothetical protein